MNSVPVIVLASRNRSKSEEIRDLLAHHDLEVRSVADFEGVPEVVEDGDSFAANAAKKAVETARRLTACQVKHWTIGEDSGLRVDALGGAPGVYSARYSGADATDKANNDKLLAALSAVPDAERGAEYVCHISLADPQGEIRVDVEATCRGKIVTGPRGTNGFGYDPLFLIPEYHRTFGELSPLVKRILSHRARAFTRLIPRLLALTLEEGRT